MDSYELFLISNRQEKIEKNKREMRKLRFQIEPLKETYNKIETLRQEYIELDKDLKKLESDYIKYSENDILFDNSNDIQLLSEEVADLEGKIQFAKCIKVGYENKKGIKGFLSSFKNFYKYKKQVSEEETHEKVSILEVSYQYIKQYSELKNNMYNTNISDMLVNYEVQKQDKIRQIEVLDYEVEERNKVVWGYSKRKPALIKRLKKVLQEIDELSKSEEYMLYTKKVQRFAYLFNQNKAFQGQIDNMIAISENPMYIKKKMCA